MNHVVNARVHKLPACPECGADALRPCVTFPGGTQVREPHNVRARIAAGEVVVLEVEGARRAKKLRALRELAATLDRPAAVMKQPGRGDLGGAISGLRRAWGLRK